MDNVDKLRKKWWGGEKGTNPEEVCNTTGRQRGVADLFRVLAFAWGRVVKRDGSESGLQHQEAATWAGQL